MVESSPLGRGTSGAGPRQDPWTCPCELRYPPGVGALPATVSGASPFLRGRRLTGVKIDRLLSIVMHLLSRDLVSASDLAGRYGVTVRTIQRDVDVINAAGIPITAIHGPRGGYKIMDTFRLDRQYLSFDDLFFITTALRGVADSFENPAIEKTMDKMRMLVSRHPPREMEERARRLFIDFSSLGASARRRDQLSVVQEALERNRCLSFEYTNSRLEATRRTVEPYTLVFKWFSWYLFAWCRRRSAFRLFRLSRIRNPVMCPEVFRRREVDVGKALEKLAHAAPEGTEVVLRFMPRIRVLVEEYFSFAELEEEPSGSLLVRFTLPDDHWLHGMILSYGDAVEVVSPEGLRTRIMEICARTLAKYGALKIYDTRLS